jgi:transcriptional regulator with XRE-family HTH domain/tetratricopeptide (TPR) repeat protein
MPERRTHEWTIVKPSSKRIVELRTRKRWTQEKLAEKALLALRTVQNIEAGKLTQLSTVTKLSEALGVPIEECILASKDGAASALLASPCPYRGLLPFREEDAPFFFGRERLIGLVRERLDQKSVLQVSGPSGSGKSSLLAAGVLPEMKKKGWRILSFRPGVDPLTALATVLISHLEPGLDDIGCAARLPALCKALEEGQMPFLLIKAAVGARGASGLLVFVDQFEEIYTLCGNHARITFLDGLARLADLSHSAASARIKVLFAIRADFLVRLFSHRGVLDAIQDADVKVGQMNPSEIDEAVRKPAAMLNVEFEEGLVERIVKDAGREPGSLPLLQFALRELWALQMGRRLTHISYEQVGQLSGAIAKRAENVFRSLSAERQQAARQILVRLVRLAEGVGEHTSQRLPISAIRGQDELNTDVARDVLDLLTDARLITRDVATDFRQETVEVAHEALIRRWPRFNQWLDDDHEMLIWRQRLGMIIREWQHADRDSNFVLRGTSLEEAKLWQSSRRRELTSLENDFIDASVEVRDERRANRPVAALEFLLENAAENGGPDSSLHERLSFLRKATSWRVRLNFIPASPSNLHARGSQLPTLSLTDVEALLGAAVLVNVDTRILDTPENLAPLTELNAEALDAIRTLQVRGASGLALELIRPQLDGIRDPELRLKFASIVFDMMHVRGRYEDAAELIDQELALYPRQTHFRTPTLLALKVRLVHHRMFYCPVPQLWSEMTDLLATCESERNDGLHGDILFMLGGNLGTLRGDYAEGRKFLVRAMRYAKRREDSYLLTRCLRKYGDYLRFSGHLRLAAIALQKALTLSSEVQGTRQRIYVMGCLGDLERQKRNLSAATDYFEQAVDLARTLYIPGWLGNLHLGLAEVAMERSTDIEAWNLLDQAEGHYRKTRPKHAWGELQVALGRCRIMRSKGDSTWEKLAAGAERDAVAMGYLKEAAFARTLQEGTAVRNVLMFL